MNEPINLLITMPFPDGLIEQLKDVSPRLKVTQIKAREPDDVPTEIWQQTNVLYTNLVIPSPEQAPNLKWIQFHWAGVDHALDAPILSKPGLITTTLSGVAASEMAEFVIMMLLAFGHRLPELIENQKLGEWPRDRFERFSPQELRESTVGIVGYGSIGRHVARVLYSFGATVLATKYDAMQPQDSGYTSEGWGDPEGNFVHRLYPYQAVRSMVKECDFVVVSVPLTPETRNIVDTEELAAMKPTAFLVDVSRGGIVNHTALIPALREHKIAGAAIDVFPEEPLPEDSPLWKLPNVILTPHIAGGSPHYDERAMEFFAENLNRFISGLPLFNRVDLKRGY